MSTNKRTRPQDSPPSNITNETIYQLIQEIRKTLDTHSGILKEQSEKFDQCIENIKSQNNRVTDLENENIQLRRRVDQLEHDIVRYQLQFVDPTKLCNDLASFKRKVIECIQTVSGVNSATIRHVSLFITSKGPTAIFTFVSSEHVRAICVKAKSIYQQYSIRIERILTQGQKSEMQQCIENAKSGKENCKVNVNLSIPVAYVNDVCVWPLNSRRRRGVSYAAAANFEPANLYKSIDLSDIIKMPPNLQLLSENAPNEAGSEFIGFALPWDGKEAVPELVQNLIHSKKVPFMVDDKDNIIYSAVALNDGKFQFSSDDGHERGATVNFLKAMASKRIVNLAIILFRKYGGEHLGPDRYNIYNGIVTRLLDKLVVLATG